MKKFIFICFLLVAVSCIEAQSKAVKDANGDLVGVVHRLDFKQAPYNNWFNRNYDSYQLDAVTVSQLKKAFKNVKVKAFMGTWCGDSKRETPHFYKLLDAVNFDEKNLEMITVNRSKMTPKNLQLGLNIIRVPTFIFYKKDPKTNKDIEVGRYVEYARESMEKDILKILNRQNYKHSYDN